MFPGTTPFRVFSTSLLVLWALVLVPCPGPAQTRPIPNVHVDIDATLNPSGETLTETVTYTIQNDSSIELASIPFWLYPNRFAQISDKLEDRNINWIYPTGKNVFF